MAVVGTAWVTIKAATEGFTAELLRDVKKATNEAEKVAKVKPEIDSSRLTPGLNLIKGKLQGFAGKNPLTSALSDITTVAGGSSSALAGLATGGMAVAGAAMTAFALKGVQEFTSLADQVRSFVRVTGTVPEVASRFIDAFDKIGIPAESATRAMGRFTKNINVNEEALKAAGIQIARNKDGTTDITETFLRFADSISKSTDSGARNTAVMKAFGREGLALLPILAKGREGVQDLFAEAADNEILSQHDLDQAEDYKFAMHDLGDAFKGLQREAGQALVPFLTDIAQAITKGVEFIDRVLDFKLSGEQQTLLSQVGKLLNPFSGGFNASGAKEIKTAVQDYTLVMDEHGKVTGRARTEEEKLVYWQEQAARGNKEAKGHLRDLGDVTTKVAGDTEDLADDELAAAQASAEAAENIQKYTDAAKAHEQALKDIMQAAQGVASAQHALADANEAVTRAQSKEADAQAKLDALLVKGTINTEKLESAQRDVASAQRAVATATDKVADAEQNARDVQERQIDALERQSDARAKLTKLISGQTAAEEMAAHAHDLEHANLRVRSSQLSLQAAQEKLAELQAAGTGSSRDLAEAQLAVDEAQLNVTESQEDLVKTTEDLAEIQNIGKEGSQELKDAQDELTGANREVATTTRDLEDAYGEWVASQSALKLSIDDLAQKEKDLKTAQAPDPKLVEDIKKARDDVTQAHRDVRDAAFNASQKTYELATAQDTLKTAMHGSLDDLREVRKQLEEIIRLQPQAAAFLQPSLDAINSLLGAALAIAQQQQAARFKPGAAPSLVGPAVPKLSADGGFRSSDFIAGENGAELIQLRPGGAMVYPAYDPMSSGGQPISIGINAYFGPGSNSEDVIAAMRSVAQNELATALKQALSSASAGRRR